MVFDIGCGDCSSLIEINNLGAKAFGIEADTNVKSIAKSLNLKVHFGSVEDNPFSGKKFDLIVMNQVIEHIPEPDKCIKIIKGDYQRMEGLFLFSLIESLSGKELQE